jgi:hypothetical protein
MQRMSWKSSARRVTLAAILSVSFVSTAGAQVCTGGPQKGGIAYVNGKGTSSSSNGAQATFVPGSVAFEIGARAIDSPPKESGFEGTFRFSLLLGGKLQFCPTIGLAFDRRTWDPDATAKVTTNQLTGRGGLAVGYDVVIKDDFDVAPFVAAEYVYRATYFQTKVTNSDANNSGDTGGDPEATFGLMARYWHVFAGYSVSHAFKGGAANERRLMIGFAF